MKKYKYYYFAYLLIIGIVFYLMNYFTPFYSDDWHYNFIYGTHNQIQSIKDILYSQYLHYFNLNGRFVPHFFVQLFDGILGKPFFNFVNTIVFVLFMHLLSSYSSKEWKNMFVSLSISAFSIFIILDGFSDEFLWMSGACNYLWTGTFLLIFDRLLHKSDISNVYTPVLLVFGFLLGWSNEALIIGVASGYLLMIKYERSHLTSLQLMMLTGFFVGSCFLVISPGSFHRFENSNKGIVLLTTYVYSYFQSLLSMRYLRILPLLLFSFLIFYSKKKVLRSFLSQNKYLIICLIISIIFIVFTKQSTSRSRFGIELFSLLLLLKMISNIRVPIKLMCLMNISVIIICLHSLINYNYLNYLEYRNVLNQIYSKKEMILTNEITPPSFFSRFIVHYMVPESSDMYHGYDKENFDNNVIAQHFGVKSLYFIPERLVNEIQHDSNCYNSFSSYPDLPFYIEKHNRGRINRVYYNLEETNFNELPYYKRQIAKRLYRYTAKKIESKAYAIVDIDGQSFIIVNKQPLIDSRVKEIIVE